MDKPLPGRPIDHLGEPVSNAERSSIARFEPRSLRTFTPTQAVLALSAGVFHWTAEGRRLYDFTSGVLVANLGHNPASWMSRFSGYMGWAGPFQRPGQAEPPSGVPVGYFPAVAMTAYNAVTPIEAEASRRLVEVLRQSKGGARMEQVMWAASGSEAIQKALWAAMARDRARPMILATRYGFHGKKGLANAVTGSEADAERDPRVRFISFPISECRDVEDRNSPFDPAPFQAELDALFRQYGHSIGTLVTEPYLGGGGSYHPPAAYLQLLQQFCRDHDIVFILDEVQSNFGRTGRMFAFEKYGVEPDIVVLGKGLGNGVPVAAAVGRADLFASLDYGEGSDTWSANPLASAAVLATLDEFANSDVVGQAREVSRIIENGLLTLKRYPFVAHVRGEADGMVWGLEMKDHQGRDAAEWANEFVLAAYFGEGKPDSDGVHLLGPLARKVIRVAPPLVISREEALAAVGLLAQAAERLANGSVKRAHER